MHGKIIAASAACIAAGTALVLTTPGLTGSGSTAAQPAQPAKPSTPATPAAPATPPKPATPAGPVAPAGDAPTLGQPPTAPALPPIALNPGDWQRDEAHLLANHVQITRREMFLKAGEAYFSPDSRWIIFQAIPAPRVGQEPSPFYSMYATELVRDPAGHIVSTRPPVLLSEAGSANTCGFFHPQTWTTDLRYDVLFASTLSAPAQDQPSGFRVGERTYRWMFPEEMEIVKGTLASVRTRSVNVQTREVKVTRTWEPYEIKPAFTHPRYDAECAYSPDGRYIVYARVRDAEAGADADKHPGKPEVDIWIFDVNRQKHHPIIVADGYDGGPFFSPDGKRLCYRSDRRGDDRLQLFVADLAFDADGAPSLAAEHQLTDDSNVNWAPFWHPSGKYLVYASSALGHQNYEVFAIEVDTTRPPAELRSRRVTHAAGADVLPVFNREGNLVMWTAQRGIMAAGEDRPSSQVWIAEVVPGGLDEPEKFFADAEKGEAPKH